MAFDFFRVAQWLPQSILVHFILFFLILVHFHHFIEKAVTLHCSLPSASGNHFLWFWIYVFFTVDVNELCGSLRTGFFHLHKVFSIHPLRSMYRYFIPFLPSNISLYWYFVYPFISCWTFQLFLQLLTIMNKVACYKHSCRSFQKISIYFWLCWVLIAILSLVAASRSYSPVVEHGLLIVVASPVAVHRGTWASIVAAPRLQRESSLVVAHELSCSMACGIFLDQGSSWYPLHCKVDS